MQNFIIHNYHFIGYMAKTAFAVLLLALIGSIESRAQDEQVPLDRDSTVYTLDADLQERLKLEDFNDYSNFIQARLYRLDENTYELVIEYESEGRNRRDRMELSPAEVENLRKRISERLESRKVKTGLNQKGRQGLLIRTGVIGALEGTFIATAADMGSQGHLAMPLIGGGLGYFVPLFATQDREVTEATAKLTGYGGFQGIMHGFAISALLGDLELDDRSMFSILSLTTAGETYAGYYMGQKYNWDVGRARIIKYNGLMGNFYGVGLAALAVGEDISPQTIGGSIILGSLGGAWTGNRLSENGRYSDGDAHLYLTSGILGAQIMGNLPVLSGSENVRLVSGSLMAGSSMGFYLAHRLADKYNLDDSGARIVRLGYGAGYLLGGALNVLASTNSKTSYAIASLASMTGYTIGLTSVLDSENRVGSKQSFIKELEVRPDVYTAGNGHLLNSFYKKGGNSNKKSVSFPSYSGNTRDITPMVSFHIAF